MSRVFVTADLHFGHTKVQEMRGVTDDDIVRNWNEVVTKRDVVYVLGDVFCLDRICDLNGIKKLVMGNHDKRPMPEYLEHFSKVRAMFEYDNCLLTHIPVHPNQQWRYRLNVHGHMHDRHVPDLRAGSATTMVPHPFYRCVSLERTDFRPVLLRDVVAQ